MALRRTLCILGVLCVAASAGAALAEDQNALASELLRGSGIGGGLVVHLGCGDGRLTAALHASDTYLVHGLDPDPANVQKARSHIQSLGLYGKVSVARLRGKTLPYTDNLVNLLVCEKPGLVPQAEIMRVLAPKGVAYVKAAGGWKKVVKPWPADIDEWTHWLHGPDGNAVGNDRVVGPPRRLQWTAGPLWSRHHDTVPSTAAMVTANGRLFYISDEAPPGLDGRLPDKWFLVARDAFNGILLWKRPIAKWGWRQWSGTWLGRFNQPIQIHKRVVAAGDRVYATLGFHAPLSVLDAATGKIIRTYQGTEWTDEILYRDGLLVLALDKDDKSPTQGGKNPVHKSVCVLDARTGKILWKKGDYIGLHAKSNLAERYGRLELTLGGDRVFLVDKKAIVALDLRTGRELWRVPRPPVRDYVALFSMRMNDLCVLVYHPDGILLFAQPEMEIRDPWHTIPGTLYAYDAKDGKLLWKHRYGGWAHFYQPDVFVINRLVWVHEHVPVKEGIPGNKHYLPNKGKLPYAVIGLDPRTGEVRKRFDTREIFNVGHHHRCYRNKSTVRYIICSRRGVELVDLATGKNFTNYWARGGCLYGILPANGLIYLTPHPCQCYITSKLNGFYALAPAGPAPTASPAPAFERGPAYDQARRSPPAATGDWPTYRGDTRRSGATATAIPPELEPLWQVAIGSKPSAPVVARGKVFVASVDEGRVVALDAATGKPLWDYIAGARVDSPPTISGELALFGSADGWVHCLRADDGALVWRRRLAPTDRLVVAHGRLESPWPVHGNILVEGGRAYAAAGRCSFLDGGIHVYALDPRTGKILEHKTVYTPDPKTGKPPRPGAYDAPGALADILVSDGAGSVYMRKMPVFGKAARKPHVYATAGFLDGNWFNRMQWIVGAVAGAQLLVFDEQTAYGIQAFGGVMRRRVFSPGTKGYRLFAADLERPKAKGPAPAGRSRRGPRVRVRWSKFVPVRAKALALAGTTLFACGAPDIVPPDDPLAAFEGKLGSVLCAFDAKSGKQLSELKLDSLPVWDGMAAAGGRLYLATRDGKIRCFGGK